MLRKPVCVHLSRGLDAVPVLLCNLHVIIRIRYGLGLFYFERASPASPAYGSRELDLIGEPPYDPDNEPISFLSSIGS